MATARATSTAGAEEWRVLEFYSGIGGMRYSLLRAGIRSEVVEAFDINNIANDVYEQNFGHRPCQGNIQTLTATDLDKYRAHAWLLSPPCQPYTRQGLQKDSADARAFSFIKILELMQQMLQPPVMLFVENVVGFETSNTHAQLIQVLTSIGFTTQEYILSPLQFGVPYSRPRYFCLAKRKPFTFLNTSFDSLLVRTPIPFIPSTPAMLNCSNNDNGRQNEICISCEPIRNFLESQCLSKKQQEFRRVELEDHVSTEHNKYDADHISVEICKPEQTQCFNAGSNRFENETEEGDADKSHLGTYSVPLNLIERWGSAMDIVYPESTRCCCFTKSYYRYVKGTGSLLATSKSREGVDVPSKDLGLRFFTPREVANLHSFPADFQFPSHVTLRQRYALLGNSLSVAVVAPLLGYLFSNHDDHERPF